jgi:hypothetical protein
MKIPIALAFSYCLAAQPAFQGYSATLTDYRNCDPRTSPCQSYSTNLVRVLPSGESYRETRLSGGGMASHIVLILSRTARIQSYPETGQYYSLPNKLVAVPTTGDAKCALAAAGLEEPPEAPRLEGEEQIGKFQTFRYSHQRADGSSYTVWLFPAAGCAILQSANVFKTGRTYQMVSDLIPAFADASVLKPKGRETSPASMLHAEFIAASKAASPPLTPDEAEKKWQETMKNPASPMYKSVAKMQETWRRAHGDSK